MLSTELCRLQPCLSLPPQRCPARLPPPATHPTRRGGRRATRRPSSRCLRAPGRRQPACSGRRRRCRPAGAATGPRCSRLRVWGKEVVRGGMHVSVWRLSMGPTARSSSLGALQPVSHLPRRSGGPTWRDGRPGQTLEHRGHRPCRFALAQSHRRRPLPRCCSWGRRRPARATGRQGRNRRPASARWS